MKVKQLFKTVLIFFLGNALSKLISFFLLPLYTAEINPIQYGNYGIAFAFINLIAPLAFLQVWDGMYRIAFDFEGKKEKNKIVSNALAFSSVGIVLYFAMFFLLRLFFKFEYFELVLIYGLVYGINYIFTFSARVHLSNKLFVFSGVMSTIVTATLNIILMVGFNWDVKSIYFSAICGIIVQMLIIEIGIGVFRHFRFSSLKKDILKQMLRFSLPLCVSTISYWLLSGFTKVLIEQFVGDYGNGIYEVANKFSVFITFLVTVIQYAWNETAYLISTEEKEERNKSYQVSLNVIITGVTVGTAFFCIFSKIIFPFMIDEKYIEAKALIPIAIIGTAANSLASFVGTFFMAEKKNRFILFSTLSAALFNVVAGYFATKYYGVLGGLTALSLGFLILALIRLLFATKTFNLKIKPWHTILSLLALVGSVVVYYYIESILILIGTLVLLLAILIIAFRKKIKDLVVSLMGKDKA